MYWPPIVGVRDRVGLRPVDLDGALELRTEIRVRPGDRIHHAVAVDVAGGNALGVEPIGELNPAEAGEVTSAATPAAGRRRSVTVTSLMRTSPLPRRNASGP